MSNHGMEIIREYFPDLNREIFSKFTRLPPLYSEWNEKINVISRKDIDQIAERHVLHSLAIAKFIQFKPETRILDVGTGGGFPGIPLAIMFPESEFHLVDSIGKKVKVVNEVSSALDLQNVTTSQIRAEQVAEKFDFVVSRAVTRMKPFLEWVKSKFSEKSFNDRSNGVIALKGGDLSEELSEIKRPYMEVNVSDYFRKEFFETKKIVYVSMVKDS